MAKTKPKAKIMVPDGKGEMVEIHDRRFEKRDWLIQMEIPKEQADTWLQYFSAECTKRGWGMAGISQLDAKENSGSFTVTTSENAQLGIIWERKRNNSMTVKADSSGTQEFSVELVNDFFFQINKRSTNRETELFYRRGHLRYEGFPWRGEIWLNENLRLGPPVIQDETALIGPRIIVVDMQINGIDSSHASAACVIALRELCIFLTVITGIDIKVSSPNGNRDWTWISDSNGKVESDIRNLGFFEKQWLKVMPAEGEARKIPLQSIRRPDLSSDGTYGDQNEMSLPEDIVNLWHVFSSLPAERKRQFLQVGSMWQVALSHYIEHRTLSFALMVVACEALKPPDKQFGNHNVNHVIKALLGKSTADLLQKYPNEFRPKNVRDAVLHLGEFRASEFIEHLTISSNSNPTFDQAYREFWEISQAAIIEWLSSNGVINLQVRKDKISLTKLAKSYFALTMLFCIIIGIVIGWLIRLLWIG